MKLASINQVIPDVRSVETDSEDPHEHGDFPMDMDDGEDDDNHEFGEDVQFEGLQGFGNDESGNDSATKPGVTEAPNLEKKLG